MKVVFLCLDRVGKFCLARQFVILTVILIHIPPSLLICLFIYFSHAIVESPRVKGKIEFYRRSFTFNVRS